MTYNAAPWSILDDVVIVDEPDANGLMCRICDVAKTKNYQANARLIAASPELLESLEELVALDGEWSNDAYAKAEAAIKKARGNE